MPWVEKNQTTKQVQNADAQRADILSGERSASLPTIVKESEAGAPAFNPIKFQPVIGTGVFEAEFGTKDDDVIFHFWPHGYHVADAANRPTPGFLPSFPATLKSVMEEVFGKNRVDIRDDRDMGAFFVRANGWVKNQFYRQQAIKACEMLFKAMGGVEG